MNTIMKLPALKPGYWWVNVAPLGKTPVWEQQVVPVSNEGRLFGHDQKEFLAKQYK